MLPRANTAESRLTALRTGFLTILHWHGPNTIGAKDLKTYLSACLDIDDVLNSTFLEQVILKCANGAKLTVPPDALDVFKAYGTRNVECVSASYSLADGPYILVGQRLLEIQRLYDDTQRTFLTTLQRLDGDVAR